MIIKKTFERRCLQTEHQNGEKNGDLSAFEHGMEWLLVTVGPWIYRQRSYIFFENI